MSNTNENIFASLENLNHQIKRVSNEESYSLNVISSDVPEMEIFEKLSKFKFREFQFVWSLLISFIILYNYFMTTYLLGMMKTPEESFLGFEVTTECIMIIDLFLRIYLKKSNQMWFLHEEMNLLMLVVLLLSSFPFSTIFAMSSILNQQTLIWLRLLKLLRFNQLLNFQKNLEMVVPEKYLKYIAITRGLLIIFYVTHYTGMFWLYINRSAIPASGSEINLYIDCILWADQSLTGIVPTTSTKDYKQTSQLYSALVMLIGAILYAWVFLFFFAYLTKLYKEESEYTKKKKILELWCERRKINHLTTERIFSYFRIFHEKAIQSISFSHPPDMPLSLLSEIALFQYRDLIAKVKLFELGEPSFVMSVVRSFNQEIYIQGDFIIRHGDLANHMYFIHKGLVEIIATDEVTRIALMDDGNYFGEIGILLNRCRTVSVKAVIPTIVASITKEKMLDILQNFQEHEAFLVQVAKQRVKTCTKEDIDISYDLVEDNHSSSDSDHSGELECPQYYAPAEHDHKPWLLRFVTVPTSKAQKGIYQIDPLSIFYYIWSGFLVLCYSFYIFMIPYSISFNPTKEYILIDLACYVVFVLDIIVNYNTSIVTKFKSFVHDKIEIHSNYINKYFILDALAIVPTDWIFYLFDFHPDSFYYLKIPRFLKVLRIVNIVQTINSHNNISLKVFKFFAYVYVFCAVGHVSACILKYLHDSDNQKTYGDNIYWVFTLYSQSGYDSADVEGNSWKLASILLIIISKLFYVFLFVECVIYIQEHNCIYVDFVKKIKRIEEWMKYCKISPSLKKKVKACFLLQWEKLQGIEDEEILQSLPECLSTDLRLNLYKGVIESGLFPSDETGAILGIIRKCKITMIPSGVSVVNRGELGFEMFFILDGRVSVHAAEDIFLKELGPGSIFGELAILEDIPGVRMATVSAITDLTLASLSVNDYREVAVSYSEFEFKVKQMARERSGKTNKLEIEDNYLVPFSSREGALSISSNFVEKRDEISLEKTNLTTILAEGKNETNELEFRPLVLRFYQNKAKDWVYFLFYFWNIVFVPLQVAFGIKYKSFLLFIEVLNISFYIVVCLYYAFVYSFKGSEFVTKHSRRSSLVYCVFHILIAFPFALINDAFRVSTSNILVLLGSYVRLLNLPLVLFFFRDLKTRKIHHFIYFQLTELLVQSVIISHISACLYLAMPDGESNDNTNLTVVEALNEYLSAFNWAFGTLIHMQSSNIEINTQSQKIVSLLTEILSFFYYGILYGGIIEIYKIYGVKLRDKFYSDYKYSMNFIRQKKIEKYKPALSQYFNHIWKSSRGVLEGLMTSSLPTSLQADIFINRYHPILAKSRILNFEGGLDISLLRSMCRLMKIRYSLIGDVIIRVDDMNRSMFFILEGEVTIVSLEGNKVIAVLLPGDHFGEANIFLDVYIRTATVVATKITYSFYLTEENIAVLSNSYPKWKEAVVRIAEQRLVKTFNANSLEEVSDICKNYSNKFSAESPIHRKLTRQSEVLISQKIAEAKVAVLIDHQLPIYALHLSVVLYSSIMVPVSISFYSLYPSWLLAMEIICFVESGFYLFMQARQNDWVAFKKILRNKNGVIYDIAAVSPFNFIFPIANFTQPYTLIQLLKSIRLLSVFKIHSLLSHLIVYNKTLFIFVIAIEVFVYILIFVNLVTCVIFMSYNCSGHQQGYTNSLYFAINVVTLTGHSDAIACDDTLNIEVLIIGFISATGLSLLYGLLSSIFSKYDKSIYQIYQKNQKAFLNVTSENAPKMLKYRIEWYSKFSAALKYNYGETIIRKVYEHLPENIIHDLVFERSRHMLNKVPFIRDSNSEILIKRIALSLEAELYMPSDYLIYKDDIGEEMYFIWIGSVNIIAPDNSKIIKSLGKGDFFGEMALINHSKRMCSVIASTLCLVYALRKKDFYQILQNFPEVLSKLKAQSDIRSRETTSVTKIIQLNSDDDEEQKRLFNHLTMFSLMSSSINTISQNKNNLSLLSGMKNIRSGTSVDTFVKDSSQNKLYKRRPNAGKKTEKRKSFDSLGKELMFQRFSRLKMKWKGEALDLKK